MENEIIFKILFVFFIICFVYHLIKIYMLTSHINAMNEMVNYELEKFCINGQVKLKKGEELSEQRIQDIKREALYFNGMQIIDKFDMDIKRKNNDTISVDFYLIKVKKKEGKKNEEEI